MKHTKNWLLAVLMLGVMVSTVHARTYEKIEFAEQLTLVDGGPVLKLNGVGTRTKFMFDVYHAALYLEHPAKDGAAIIADTGAKRMLMHIAHSEVPKDKITQTWKDSMRANVSAVVFKAIEGRLDAFFAMHDATYVKGDTIIFDCLPGKGTRMISKGVDKGIVPGDDFYAAVVSVWVGKEPPSEKFKKALLGAQ